MRRDEPLAPRSDDTAAAPAGTTAPAPAPIARSGGRRPTHGAITGWGGALPGHVVTNASLSRHLDTSDGWITERTGIRERRIGGTTAQLGAEAGRRALRRAGRHPAEVDVVLLATCTPDVAVPATATDIQAELRCGGTAVDLNAACAGFVHALVVAFGLLETGARCVLVIGAETLSRITDWGDRATAVLFADGAGAVVVEARDGPGALLGCDLGTDPTGRALIHAPLGGTLSMDGREVFRRAVRATVASVERVLATAGVDPGSIALVVHHQANRRIIDAAAARLGIEPQRWVSTLARTGNTSAASVPYALSEAATGGALRTGDLVLLAAFGAGMTWGSAVLRWQPEGRA